MIFKILTSRFDKFVPNCCMRYIGHKISLHIFESLKMEKYLIKSKVHENVYATSKSSQSHCFGLFLGNVCSFFFHRHVFHPQILLQISRPGGANRIFGPSQDLQCKRAMQQSKLKKEYWDINSSRNIFFLFCSLLLKIEFGSHTFHYLLHI